MRPYQVVAFCLNKAIEQQFALNYHCRNFPFCLHVDLFESGEGETCVSGRKTPNSLSFSLPLKPCCMAVICDLEQS